MTATTTDDVITQLKGLIEFHTIQRGRCVDALRALRGDDAEPRIEVDTQKEGPAMPTLRPPKSAAKSIGQRTRQAPKKQAPARDKSRGPKHDYAAVAKVASDAHRDGKPMGPAVANHFAVALAMGNWLIAEARKKGHHVPRRGEQAAIEPGDIRHEVGPIPADRKLAVAEHNEPILGVNTFGFADRPTHVEHDPPETVRNGWYPGKAAELAGADKNV